MLRYHSNNQRTLWEAVLPPEVLALPEELRKINQFLADPEFMEPFRVFETGIGRPTVPVEVFQRMMYLKYRYEYGYETLVEEVSDSVKFRIFCKIGLEGKVPDSTTLIKLNQKYGEEPIKQLNDLLVKKAKEKRIIRGRKLRSDTTVIESNIHYPTDTSILADGVRVVTRTIEKLKESGLAARTKFINRKRSIRKRLFKIKNILKSKAKDKKKKIQQLTEEIVTITKRVIEEAESIVTNTHRTIRTKVGRIKTKTDQTQRDVRTGIGQIKEDFKEHLLPHLEEGLSLLEAIVGQTELVLEGKESGEEVRISNRIISFFDTEARAIKKAKLNKPVEFGRKIALSEVENGIISDYRILDGNPVDSKLLEEDINRHIQIFGQPPAETANDRGYWSKGNQEMLYAKGVGKPCLPKRGYKSKDRREYENQYWFKRLKRWRAGEEARISHLKRKWGLDRSLSRGDRGTKTWAGHSIFAYNLNRVATFG